jgi:hypothetical protein
MGVYLVARARIMHLPFFFLSRRNISHTVKNVRSANCAGLGPFLQNFESTTWKPNFVLVTWFLYQLVLAKFVICIAVTMRNSVFNNPNQRRMQVIRLRELWNMKAFKIHSLFQRDVAIAQTKQKSVCLLWVINCSQRFNCTASLPTLFLSPSNNEICSRPGAYHIFKHERCSLMPSYYTFVLIIHTYMESRARSRKINARERSIFIVKCPLFICIYACQITRSHFSHACQ